MMLSRLGSSLRLIRTRLLLVIIVSGVGIHLLLLAALTANRALLADAVRNSVAQYASYLVMDLGSPPDFNRAVELAERIGMNIHYFSPEATWSTSGRPPSTSAERLHALDDTGRIQAGGFRRHHFLIYQEDLDHRFIFELVRTPAQDRLLGWVGASLVILVTLLLIGAYLWIRRIMAPLRQLTQGVRQVGAGRLDHRVEVGRPDELGELASSFNHMAERLQHLIGSKDQMLLDVSHELRSPLTRMKVALEMAPDGALKESLAEDVVEMERMVTTILANARSQSHALSLDLQKINLAALIRDEIKPYQLQPPGVVMEDPPESAEILVDTDKVKSLLRNVVGNAVKYSNETSGPIAVRLRTEPDSITLEIEDHGIGIPEQDLPFVLEPFYRVDRSRSRETGGFGLGLSLCKAIMDAHGGSISIQSVFGEGTTVRLHFPHRQSEET
jgi:signal transduction histidine kinase